ncbi:MAG: hypothetical protein ACRD0J_04575 [Acidimicrobiales bacterium]
MVVASSMPVRDQPASATVIGLVVLGQVPTVLDLAGIALVVAGAALHQAPGPPH